MPYIVKRGEVHHDGAVYTVGEGLPLKKGEAEDMVATGAVEWAEPKRGPNKAKAKP